MLLVYVCVCLNMGQTRKESETAVWFIKSMKHRRKFVKDFHWRLEIWILRFFFSVVLGFREIIIFFKIFFWKDNKTNQIKNKIFFYRRIESLFYNLFFISHHPKNYIIITSSTNNRIHPVLMCIGGIGGNGFREYSRLVFPRSQQKKKNQIW